LNALLISVDDEEGSVCPLKFITGVAADAAKTADDEMVVQVFDHVFFPAVAGGILQLEFNDSLGHGADG
jgi:hypothetical protein